MAANRAVFFDRDGVLNEAVVRNGRPFPPGNLDELRVTSGAHGLLQSLHARCFRLLVISNQPDVARGTTTRECVDEINRALAEALPLDRFYVCYHSGDECGCRKPKPGLFFDAERDFGLDLARSWAIGDRWRDIAAARAAGVPSILIDHGYREDFCSLPPDVRVADLGEAVDWILTEEDAARDD